MKRLTVFTFGYYGWGNSTSQLVQAIDTVERSRGYKPPIFVDIRIRRAVRAPGFNGNSFGELLGEKRHQWMKSLGNKAIETRTGPPIQIAEPNAVNDLLDLAVRAMEDRRRLIMFCSCEFPVDPGWKKCHRTKVASLTVQAAKRQGITVEIVEWPGGELGQIDLNIDPKSFEELLQGKWRVPTGKMSLAECAGIAWGSIARIRCDDQSTKAVIGPAQFRFEKWQLPIFLRSDDYTLAEMRQESKRVRKSYGFEAVR